MLDDLLVHVDEADTTTFQHGSTTGIYDSEGRFVGETFDNTFAKWDDDQDGALCLHDLFQMMRANRDVLDVFGVSNIPDLASLNLRILI